MITRFLPSNSSVTAVHSPVARRVEAFSSAHHGACLTLMGLGKRDVALCAANLLQSLADGLPAGGGDCAAARRLVSGALQLADRLERIGPVNAPGEGGFVDGEGALQGAFSNQ